MGAEPQQAHYALHQLPSPLPPSTVAFVTCLSVCTPLAPHCTQRSCFTEARACASVCLCVLISRQSLGHADIQIVFIVIIHVCMYMCVMVLCGGQKTTLRSWFSSPAVCFFWSNSVSQAWQQTPLPSEPPCCCPSPGFGGCLSTTLFLLWVRS